MKKLIIVVTLFFLITSCERNESLKTENETKRQLTSAEKILKSNLDKTAKLLAQIITDKEVQKEFRKFSMDKNDQNSIFFKDLSHLTKTPKQFTSLIKGLEQVVDLQKGEDDLLQYLADKNCSIYIPYPLDWYSADKPIAIAGHPIDNNNEGVGYLYSESKMIQEVIVNEEYTNTNPVMLVMPEDPEDPGIGGGGGTVTPTDPPFGESGTGPNSIFTVYIGYVRCADMCGGLFEGDIELRIKRVQPYFSTSTNSVEVNDPVELHINYPKAYAKAAVNNWSNSNGGWLKVNATWDTNWSLEKDRQGIIAYDYDWDSSVKKVTIGVTYKGMGLNLSLERDIKYEGDFLGKNDQWWRDWFYATQATPTPYDEVYQGLTVRSLGSLKFTTPTYTLHY